MSPSQTSRLLKRLALPIAFAMFVAGSLLFDLSAGIRAGRNFLSFGREMIAIVPATFILIGLFEAWIPQEKIERHLGQEAGFASHFWSMILAGSTVGGLMVAFPVAYSLRRKGARHAVVFSYLGTAGVVRVPMTLFEMSFLGVPFTLVRYAVALPLLIAMAEILGQVLDRRGFEMRTPSRDTTAGTRPHPRRPE
ncbi:MAG: hypothetical protein R6W94_01875 [Spirochaetia bacterium]